jgi:putative ABC transport system permease protein
MGRIQESVKLLFNRKVSFGYAISIPDGEDRKTLEYILRMEAQKGRLLEDGDGGAVFLGSNFIEEDNVFGKVILPGSKISIQDVEFKVVGIMEKKGSIGLDGAVFINEDDLRDLIDRQGDEYDVIGAVISQNVDVSKIQSDIEKKLRRIRDVDEGEEDFAVETPQSILENVNNVLLGVQIFVYIIAGISILVGGIGIMNTMYTSVVERTKEIGIMKSIGAKNGAIFSLFFIESGLLGSVGGAVGALFGYLAATGLAFAGRFALGSDLIAAHVTPQLIIASILFSFVVGSFFGTFPAVQASKLNPVDALRSTK